jgi:hypothetical protein
MKASPNYEFFRRLLERSFPKHDEQGRLLDVPPDDLA